MNVTAQVKEMFKRLKDVRVEIGELSLCTTDEFRRTHGRIDDANTKIEEMKLQKTVSDHKQHELRKRVDQLLGRVEEQTVELK